MANPIGDLAKALTAAAGAPLDLCLKNTDAASVEAFLSNYRRYATSTQNPISLVKLIEPSLVTILELSLEDFSSTAEDTANITALESLLAPPDDLSLFRALKSIRMASQGLSASNLRSSFTDYASKFLKRLSTSKNSEKLLQNAEVLLQFASGLAPQRFREDVLQEVKLLNGNPGENSFQEVVKLTLAHISMWSYSNAFWTDDKTSSKTVARKPRSTEPTVGERPAGVICYNCLEKDHRSPDCKKAFKARPDNHWSYQFIRKPTAPVKNVAVDFEAYNDLARNFNVLTRGFGQESVSIRADTGAIVSTADRSIAHCGKSFDISPPINLTGMFGKGTASTGVTLTISDPKNSSAFIKHNFVVTDLAKDPAGAKIIFGTDILSDDDNPFSFPYFWDRKGGNVNEVSDSQTFDNLLPVLSLFPDNESVSDKIIQNLNHHSSSLPEEDRFALQTLLLSFSDVFSGLNPQPMKVRPISIPIKANVVPINQKSRTVPFAHRNFVSNEIRSWRELGICQPSQSEWSSNICVVGKKNGTLRLCVDTRALNECVDSIPSPLPSIPDIFDSLGGKKWFFALDLTSGFLQIPLDEKSIPFTAFRTPLGKFELLRLFFGYKNAPIEFQARLEEILRSLIESGLLHVFIDDILGAVSDFPELLVLLEKVLSILRDVNAKLSIDKCRFAVTELEYLGFVIDAEGRHISPTRMQGIVTMPPPTNIKLLRKFLGVVAYLREFLPRLSTLAAPLYYLEKKNVTFNWGVEQQQAYVAIKNAILNSGTLFYPDLNKSFTLYCDASDVGIGSALCQPDKTKDRPVSFYSRTLSSTERNYPIMDRELLALVASIKNYTTYLKGTTFTAYTDHLNLLSMTNSNNGRVRRSLEFLSQFSFKLEHIPGVDNPLADALSRLLPVKDLPPVDFLPLKTLGTTDSGIIPVWEEFNQEVNFVPLLSFEDESLCTRILEAQALLISDKTQVKGLVKRHCKFGECLCLPSKDNSFYIYVPPSKSLRFDIMFQAHYSIGHFATEKTVSAIHKAKLSWPSLVSDVKEFISLCSTCQKVKAGNNVSSYSTVLPRKFSAPYESVQMDFLGPFPESLSGNSYVLNIKDVFTRYCELCPTPTCNSSDAAKAFYFGWVKTHGIPTGVQSDRGPHFVNKLFVELFKFFSVPHHLSTPYHPASNGIVERQNGLVLHILRSMILDSVSEDYCFDKDTWCCFLPAIQLALNTSTVSSIGVSPFEAIHGTPAITPLLSALGEDGGTVTADSIPEYMKALKPIKEKIHGIMLLSQDNYLKKLVSSKVKRPTVTFSAGDWVLVHFVDKKDKLTLHYRGPYLLTEVINDVTYNVQHPGTGTTRQVHQSMLKPFLARDYSKKVMIAEAARDEQGAYAPQAILDHIPGPDGGTPELSLFKVRWKGFGPQDDTFEPFKNISHIKLLKDYVTANKDLFD
eukprot:TRINITY_DN549_c1_g1_i2.p2 TRINITY_DN549_c1_g1~~TRINITY_DN549_c1_g1_i2.p2  ORF type:complete len:1430 (+),score=268.62 TRINITY_DN549_c1_g1_i2:4611-8900(+)